MYRVRFAVLALVALTLPLAGCKKDTVAKVHHPATLEESVGSDGGAVEQLNRRGAFVQSPAHVGDRLGDGARGIGGSGKDFQDFQAAGAEKNAVGEGSAGVDGDAHGRNAILLRKAQLEKRRSQ